ncbi:MAG: hypothetical protein ACK50F_11680 [Betaproteobacteria bacterium]|nr:hypothetical protein [Rubrivivax sp.]
MEFAQALAGVFETLGVEGQPAAEVALAAVRVPVGQHDLGPLTPLAAGQRLQVHLLQPRRHGHQLRASPQGRQQLPLQMQQERRRQHQQRTGTAAEDDDDPAPARAG